MPTCVPPREAPTSWPMISSASAMEMPRCRCPSSEERTARLTFSPAATVSKRPSTLSRPSCGPALKSCRRIREQIAVETRGRGTVGATGPLEDCAGRWGTMSASMPPTRTPWPCAAAAPWPPGARASARRVRRLQGSRRPSPSLSVSIMSHSSWLRVRYGSACMSATRNSWSDTRPLQPDLEPAARRCSAGARRLKSTYSRPASVGTPALRAASVAATS
mmetsp:Transcript_110677/g.238197  ORF Transcript_110677/g.238197 Transcript_110677/m.238197 type:complete len:219 (-) Transcript_110677:1426-2082(-)